MNSTYKHSWKSRGILHQVLLPLLSDFFPVPPFSATFLQLLSFPSSAFFFILYCFSFSAILPPSLLLCWPPSLPLSLSHCLPLSSLAEIMRVYQGAVRWRGDRWSPLQQAERGERQREKWEKEKDEDKNLLIVREQGELLASQFYGNISKNQSDEWTFFFEIAWWSDLYFKVFEVFWLWLISPLLLYSEIYIAGLINIQWQACRLVWKALNVAV